MNRFIACGCICLLVSGCFLPKVYQLDFSKEPGFEWDGKVKITKTAHLRLGPLLILDENWKVDRVEFCSRDGRAVAIDTDGDGADATVEPNTPRSHRVYGSDIYIGEMMRPAIDMTKKTAANVVKGYRATTHPSGLELMRAIGGAPTTRPVPTASRPYAEHADQLKLADWCALAMEHADDVTVEYRVPEENLRIVIRSHPRTSGPGVLEVWSADGRLLKRFQQKEVVTRGARAGTTSTSSPAATSQPR